MTNWIYKIKELEEATGQLYLMISKKIGKTYPEMSELFDQLYQDEVHHGNQVDFLNNIFKESENSFNGNERSIGILSDNLRFINDIRKVIEEKELFLHPVDLLKIAIELEEEIKEGHEAMSEGISDPELKKLVKSMAMEDKIHIKRIKDFLEVYNKGLPVPE